MVERGSTSERASFDPYWMAELETEFRKNLLSKNTQTAIANQGLMYMEQWRLNNIDAQKASYLYFKDRTHAHYTIISQGSGLNFNSLEATLAYYDALKKVTKNDPIPMRAASKLFSVIYSIDPEAETLWEAMDLRGTAFRRLPDLYQFKRYVKDYYQYLKWAANDQDYQLPINNLASK